MFIITPYGISRIWEGLTSFKAAKNITIAIESHKAIWREIIKHGVVSNNSRDGIYPSALLSVNIVTPAAGDPSANDYGRLGYIAGRDADGLTWPIYMDILLQLGEDLNQWAVARCSPTYLRIEFLTTRQLPSYKYLILQDNAFEITVLGVADRLDLSSPYPQGNVPGDSVTIYLWLPWLGLTSVTISWNEVKVTMGTISNGEITWLNYGPVKSWWPIFPRYLDWNEIYGSLSNDRPNDVGVRLEVVGVVEGTWSLKVSGHVTIYYNDEYLPEYYEISFPQRTFNIQVYSQ